MQLDPSDDIIEDLFAESISSEELPLQIVCIKKFILLKLTLRLINIYDHIDKNINL